MWPRVLLTKQREKELEREISRLVEHKGKSIVAIKKDDVRAWLCQPGGETVDYCRGILLERCDSDLSDYIAGFCEKAAANPLETMSPENRRVLSAQVLEAYAECHASKIAHRDVKPQNILVKVEAGRLKVKLCDFGTSFEHRIGDTATGTVVLTMEEGHVWGSPEMLSKYFMKSMDVIPLTHDLWGIGWYLQNIMFALLSFTRFFLF
jgi:serine/threonine protein kinase